MQILESALPTFRYHYKWGPKPSPYLAASRVIVLELDNPAFVDRCNASFAKMSSPSKPGGVRMAEMAQRWMNDTSALLRDALLAAGVPPFYMMDDLEPMLVRLEDQVSYHVDMPLWSNVFGAWMLDGPERTLRFPYMGIEVPFKPGTLVLFDPAQPHALLRKGATKYESFDDAKEYAIKMVHFACFKRDVLMDLMGLQEYAPEKHEPLRHTVDQYSACPETGALKFRD